MARNLVALQDAYGLSAVGVGSALEHVRSYARLATGNRLPAAD